nr:4-hydroxybenzoate octaprenyltransferase [Campylobacter sp.]
IPARYGWEAALFISKLFHTLSVIFWFLFVWGAGLGVIAYFGVVVNAVILYFEHKIVVRDFSKIDRAFFTLNGYLGILFFIFVWISLW